MPDMRVEMKYTLALTKDELTLVQRALRCLLTAEEQAPALVLQEAILLQRARLLDQMANEADKAAENIERAQQRRLHEHTHDVVTRPDMGKRKP